MPEQQRLIELRRLDVAAGRELLEPAIETRHGRLQVGECLARVCSRLEAVTQGIELVRDLLRIGLHHARRLQSDDAGAHVRGDTKPCEEHGAHRERQQHRAHAHRDELAISVCP